MLLICSTPDTIRRGYRALLAAGVTAQSVEKRIPGSLKRIAATKALVKSPPPLDMDKYNQLANDIRQLNERLNIAIQENPMCNDRGTRTGA